MAACAQVSPVITWTNPAAITYGTALSSVQLNASANVSGTLAYNPASGIVPDAGTNILSVVFTPEDTVDYTSATNSVILVVTNYAVSYTFTTLAGMAAVPGTANGSGGTARFGGPWGVALDGAGNIFVPDTLKNTIRKITPAGAVTTIAGLPGQAGNADGTGSAARFNGPTGVAVDATGNVYVADQDNNMIRKIKPVGTTWVVSTFAGGIAPGHNDGTGTAARFFSPQDVAVDRAGNIYVADVFNSAIRKLTPLGVVTTLAGGTSGSSDGTGSAARFSAPCAVAVDNATNIYVADQGNSTIRKVTPAGVVTTPAGLANKQGSIDGTGSAARFESPGGVAVDGAGNVYIADTFNYTIRKMTPTGTVTTLAGLAGVAGGADGTGSATRFATPQGLKLDAAGNIYVADIYNYTIRKGFPPVYQPRIALSFLSINGPQVHLTGTGGFPGGQYNVLTATNAITPVANWVPLTTNFFDANGGFSFTNASAPNESQRFYILQVP